jgi:hypothetical protein
MYKRMSKGVNMEIRLRRHRSKEKVHEIYMRGLTQNSNQDVLGKEQRAQRREVDGRGGDGGNGEGWRAV